MSYGGYNPYDSNGGGRGYGSNPFDDRNAMQYGAGGGHEMSSFSQANTPQRSQQGFGSPVAARQTSILDECIDIQNGIQDVESKLGVLNGLQKRALEAADMTGGSSIKRELDNLTQAIMDQYRDLTQRLRTVKSNPDSRQPRNVAQVNKTDRDLRRAIQKFQEIEAGSRREMRQQMERQARIVYDKATDAEIAEIVNSDTQIFQQAVMGSRAEQANRVLGAVKQRHQEMLEIEKSLIELMDLLNSVQELLTKQEETVMAIETHAEQAAGDMVKANEELETAVTTARKTRKKKWICLGICVTIVIIIVVAVVAYIMVNRAANGGGGGGGGGNNNNDSNNNDNNNSDSDNNDASNSAKKRSIFQRSVLDDLQMNTARAAKISAEVLPTAQQPRSTNADNRLTVRLPRRPASWVRDAGATSGQKAEHAVKERFVVDWDGPGSDSTGSKA